MENLIQQLDLASYKAKRNYQAYKEAKQQQDELKEQIAAKLQELGLKSAKTELGTVAMVSKPRMVIANEAQVMHWLEETPEIEGDLYINLNKRAVESLAKTWFKDTGEQITGVEFQDTEYISYKPTKEQTL